MIYKQYDYSVPEKDMQKKWNRHWEGRSGWDPDHTKNALWHTIEDIIARPGLTLEAGCGSGKWVYYFNKLGHHAIGVDYAWTALNVAKTTDPTLQVSRVNCCEMPFSSDLFDYVFANGTIEHDIAGPDCMLKEFYRVLKPGGWLMSSVPCLNTERLIMYWWLVTRDWLKRRKTLRRIAGKTDPYLFYQYVFTPNTYRKFLQAIGFTVKCLRPYGEESGLPLIELLRPMLRDRFPFYSSHMVMGICQKPEK